MKPEHIWKFYRLLKGRGMSLTKIAPELKTTPSHLSQVINGQRGAYTRKHIARYLTEEETTLLGWAEKGEVVPAVPQGTMSQEEQPCE